MLGRGLSHRVPGPGDCSRPYHISRGTRLVDGVDRRKACKIYYFSPLGFFVRCTAGFNYAPAYVGVTYAHIWARAFGSMYSGY
ncbi:hypothetical protein CERSUDRAFT_120399 [Gelatoporia subvermispora B]|uniref:Uncharacterized protein n=1 Tax=Ceriporiopsis subvermispora (strain B) TaxID=914234 RepID=M2P590_CERS8|nr:hypothetical protein CERSUDRAFT_120399 [Gelatoporia subvermispora B]